MIKINKSKLIYITDEVKKEIFENTKELDDFGIKISFNMRIKHIINKLKGGK